MKNAWLVISGCIESSKFSEIYESLNNAATKRDIVFKIKKNSEFTVSTVPEFIISEEKPDFILFWDKDVDLAYAFETLGIPVFNRARSIYICDDKFLTHRELSKFDIPMPKTFKLPFKYPKMDYKQDSFFDLIEEKLSYPMILKCTKGSFGEQVYLCDNRNEIIEKMNNHPYDSMIIQEYIKSEYGRDLRMYMVGNKLVSAITRNNENDFRANIHLGGYGLKYEANDKEIELAREIMKILKLDFAGIDFLFDENKNLLLCEVNSNAHFKELYEVSGINAAENIIEYIDDRT